MISTRWISSAGRTAQNSITNVATIQTVPGSSQIATPEAAVKADFGALNAPNRANMQLAGTIGDLGQEAAAFGQQLQAAKNFGIAADADRAMRQAAADFKASRVGRTDEENWGTEWREKADEVRSSIYDKGGIGPDLRRTLDNNFKDWNQANSIEVRTIAQKQAINRVRISAADAADEAAKDGDEAGVINAIKGAMIHGAYYPEEANHLIGQGLSKIDQYKADNFIEANPVKAVDWLREKDETGNFVNATRINPDQRRIMIRNAEIQSSRMQADNYDEAKLAVDNGDVPTPETINRMENEGHIAAKQAAGLRTYIKTKGSQPRIEEQPKNAAAVTAAINAIPQGLDADSRRPYITDIVTSPAYLKLMEPARRQMDEWMKQDAVQEKPVVAEVLKQAEQMYRDGFFLPRAAEDVPSETIGGWSFAGGAFTRTPKVDVAGETKMSAAPDLGKDNPDADASHWLKTAPKAIVDATQMHYAQYLTRMRSYAKANPKATDADVTKESQRLMEPYVMSAVTQSLRPTATPANVTQAEYDALKSGDTYYWNGQPLRKK